MKASVRLVRFATIGTLNYLITMLVIWIVMSYFSFKGKYIVANIMAYLIAQTHNLYGANIGFPSSNPQNSLWQQIMLFCTAFGIAYGIQLLFVILMIEAIGIKEFTAQFIGIIIYGAVNFMVNNRITFR
jgi:GtrA-like protein.